MKLLPLDRFLNPQSSRGGGGGGRGRGEFSVSVVCSAQSTCQLIPVLQGRPVAAAAVAADSEEAAAEEEAGVGVVEAVSVEEV